MASTKHTRSATTRKPKRPRPQRFQQTSGRGAHAAGRTFTNVAIVEAAVNTNDLVLTLDQRISLVGMPQILTDIDGPVPEAVSLDATGTILTITFDGDLTGATQVRLTRNDPSMRTATGGWLTSLVFPI